jgi:hypothetical protein
MAVIRLEYGVKPNNLNPWNDALNAGEIITTVQSHQAVDLVRPKTK